MALDWLNTPLDANVSDLLARKKRGKAIEVLREQLLRSGENPSAQGRLQLVDLLVLAGRSMEAVPILLGLADEFAREGFVAKAVAVLKRIDRIEPGRADVESKLASLVQQQTRAAPSLTTTMRRMPEFGIEEIREEAFAAAQVEEAPAAAPSDATVIPEAAAAETPPAEAPAATIPEPEASPLEIAAPSESEGDGATHPLKNVFGRFLASLPEQPEALTAPLDRPEPTPAGPSGDSFEPAAAEPQAAGASAGEPASEPTREASGAEELEPAPQAPAQAAAPPEPAPATRKLASRIKGVFRRFLASSEAPSAASAASEAEPPKPTEPEVSEPAAAPAEPETPSAELAVEPVPGEAESPSAPEASPPAEGSGVEPPSPRVREEPDAEERPAAAVAPAEAAEPVPETETVLPPEPLPIELDAAAAAPETDVREQALEITIDDERPEASDSGDTMSQERFEDQLLDLVQDVASRPSHAPAAPPRPGLRAADFGLQLVASPLFRELAEEELLAVMKGLELLTFEAGDIVITEGEPGGSLYIVATGRLKVFVRNPAGRNFEVGRLEEGDFFGEISALSSRPRTATVAAAAHCELLELDKQALDEVARRHPHVRDTLDAYYIQRASSPEAAAVRAVPIGGQGKKAIEILEAHFGESRWDPRMRLRLADVLLKAGHDDDAVPILVGLADDFAREGFPEKAIAVLKKIEMIKRRHVEEVNLAPLTGKQPKKQKKPKQAAKPGETTAAASGRPRPRAPQTTGDFKGWLVDVVRDVARRRSAVPARGLPPLLARPEGLRAYLHERQLRTNPLFDGFTEDELLALIQGLRLIDFDPGEIVLTEGEPGESVFILSTGKVKVFIRNPRKRNVLLCELPEGTFFGEISTLTGRPRSATITAAARCELLELDAATLEHIAARHPRVRKVLEEYSTARDADPAAAAIRTMSFGDAAPRS